MPKMKTHKGLAGRFRKTAKGKVRYKKSNAGHLMSSKSGGKCRRLRRPGILKPAFGKIVGQMLSRG